MNAQIAPLNAPALEPILSAEAVDFLAELHARFDARRRELLAARAERRPRSPAAPPRLPARDGDDPRGATGGPPRRAPTTSTAGSRSPARPTASW